MAKLNMNNPLFGVQAEEEAQETKEAQEARKKAGRPRNGDLVRDNSAQAGLPEEWQRATFILKVSALNDLKDYAYTRRIPLKDALTEVIEKFIEEYKGNPDNEPLLPHKK